METDPALLFYTKDFIFDTRFFTKEQTGEYILLICLQHQEGHLTEEQLKSVSSDPKILSKWIKLEDGKYHNLLVHEAVMKRKKFRESRLLNLNKGKNNTHMGSHMDNHMESHKDSHMINENVNVNINANKDVNINKNTIKIKRNNKFIKPALEEVILYFNSKGYNLDHAKSFYEYYNVSEWKDSQGNQVKNWKQKAIGVWFKDRNLISGEQKQNGTTENRNGTHQNKSGFDLDKAKTRQTDILQTGLNALQRLRQHQGTSGENPDKTNENVNYIREGCDRRAITDNSVNSLKEAII